MQRNINIRLHSFKCLHHYTARLKKKYYHVPYKTPAVVFSDNPSSESFNANENTAKYEKMLIRDSAQKSRQRDRVP